MGCQVSLNEIIKQQHQADQLFSTNQLKQAANFYRHIIEQSIQLDLNFEGFGNKQEQQGYYQWNVFNWYLTQKNANNKKGSPYDGLSLCESTLSQAENIEGLNWYRKMIEKYPKNIQLLHAYANLLNNSSKIDQAKRKYTKVLELQPNFLKAKEALCLIYTFKRPKRQLSQFWMTSILQKDDKNKFALLVNAIGGYAAIQKITSLQIILQVYPDYALPAYLIGKIYQQQMLNNQQAMKWYEKCMMLYPKYWASYYGAANINKNIKNYDEAIHLYMNAAQLSSNSLIYDNLIQIFSLKQLNDQQIQQIKKKSIHNKEEEFWNKLSVAYFEKKKFDRSIDCISRTLQINQNDYEANFQWGLIHYLRKQYIEANTMFEKCNKINNNRVDADNQICRIYNATKRYSQAIQYSIQLLKKDPINSLTHRNIGLGYRNSNNFTKAIQYLVKAIWFNANDILSIAYLADCYSKTNNRQMVLNCCQKIIRTIQLNQMSISYERLGESSINYLDHILSQYCRKFDGFADEERNQILKSLKSKEEIQGKFVQNFQTSLNTRLDQGIILNQIVPTETKTVIQSLQKIYIASQIQ